MNSEDEVSLSFRRLSVRDHEIYCHVNRFSPQFERDNMCFMSKKQRHVNGNIPFLEHTVHDLSQSYVMDVDNFGPSSRCALSKYTFESSDVELSLDSSDSELDDDCGKTCNVNPSNGKAYKEPVKKTDKLNKQHFSMFRSTQSKSARESASVKKSNSESAERALQAKQRKEDDKKRKSREATAEALQKAKSKVVKTTGKILPAFSGFFRNIKLDMAGIATQRRK